MGLLSRFSTDAFGTSERMDVWSHHWRSVVGLEVRGLDPGDFHGSLDARDLAVVQLARITVGAHEIERTRNLISHIDFDLLKVVFQISGETCIAQGDECARIKPGEWMIYDLSRPYHLSNFAPTEQLALMIPRTAFCGLKDGARILAMRPAPVQCGPVKLLKRCVTGSLDDLGEEHSLLDPDIGGMLVDLFRLSMRDRLGGRDRTTMRDTMREKVKNYIRRNLEDPELNLDRIALAMHCTKRYLHKIFSGGQTISDYIWTLRIERCGEHLADPINAYRSVTEIAFAHGFRNSPHFSRAFKSHYGMSPRDFRTQCATRSIRKLPN